MSNKLQKDMGMSDRCILEQYMYYNITYDRVRI